ncbi:MAG: pilus assembly protein FimV, partial [Gammaproteobacteria bacterium]|nr:pilus assembly protein FimV [Gammaproteobacteria bacterium]
MRCALLAALVGLWPAVSPALSLGEARVLSALDAPLEAEIDVLDVTPDELQALTVEIPSRDVFVRYGVVRPVYLETARVALARGKDGRPVLQLRTRAKVTDPFLTVLILADWGRGRVLREFNLVIDRPVLAPQAAAAAPI